VKFAFALLALVLPATAPAPACGAALKSSEPAIAAGAPARARGGDPVTDTRTAISQRFPNLDAYLAHLEKGARMDGAWYRQVRPGVYELQTGNLRLPDGGKRQRIFTREELEKKFGFSR
jgi:hypothetical protein